MSRTTEGSAFSIRDKVSPRRNEVSSFGGWRRDRRKAGSSGLGLSIVQRVAELHSATIMVENRIPPGARFSLEFVPLN